MQQNMLPITRPDMLETRDRLRALPRTGSMLQQTLQYLTRASQGGIPTVEPIIALSELNEIKRDMEKQSSAQATAGNAQAGPMVQTLPEQVKQSAGIASLQGLQQQQGMQQMAQRAAQTPQPIPQGVPQPQAQSEPMSAMRGGLMALKNRPNLNYRSGGIIAFQSRGAVEDPDAQETETETETEDGDTVVADASSVSLGAPINVNRQISDMDAQIEAQKNRPPAALTNKMIGPASVEQQMTKADPDRYGILGTPAGQESLNRLRQFQNFQAQDIGQRASEVRKINPGQIMIDAAEASRGVKGGFGQIAAMLGGAGKSITSQQDQRLKQMQEMRKEGLGLAEARMVAENKVEELRRAQAKGDVQGEYNARLALAKIEKDYGVSLNNLLGKQYAAVLGYKGRVDSAAMIAAAKAKAASAGGDKTKVPEQLARARLELNRLTPGTPEYDAKAADVKALQQTVQENRDVGPNRASIMRQQILSTENRSVQKAMGDFEYSPAMQAAKLEGPEAEARVFSQELAKQRALFPKDESEFPGSEPKPAAPAAPTASAPKPEAVFVGTPVPLPKGATAATLKVGEVYQTAKGPGRWNGTGFTPVQVSK